MSETLDTKERILRLALQLIREKSYNSISFNDIAKNIIIKGQPIKKASIHYHFESKVILGIAAVRYFRERIITHTEELDISNEGSWFKLDAYFRYFSNGLEKGLVCPAGVLSAEINSIPIEMQQEIRFLFNYYLDWLEKLLDTGRNIGDFHFNQSPRDLAHLISSTMQGAMFLSRAYGKQKQFDLVISQLKDILR